MVKTVTFKVGMTCGGCKGAVTKVLTKIEGVQGIDANVDTKIVSVQVNDNVDSATLLAALSKWSAASGKSVELVA